MKQYVLMKKKSFLLQISQLYLGGKGLNFSLTNIEKGYVLKTFTFIVDARPNLSLEVQQRSIP